MRTSASASAGPICRRRSARSRRSSGSGDLVTHEYTLLVGGTVLPGMERPSVSAIAWAEGIVLALGTDEQVLDVSRGDSRVIELHGEFVVPIGVDDGATWPPTATLEIGGPADFAVLLDDPRVARSRPSRVVGSCVAGTSSAGR